MAGAATTSQINGGTSNQTAAADGASKAAVKKATKAAKVAIDPEVIRQRRAEKAARREAEAEANKGKEPEPVKLGFTAREFVRIPGASAAHCSDGQRHSERPKRRIKVMTWNMLAQALVRRTLFPGSDMLRWKDRQPVLTQEILHYNPDIACLQEVDKIDTHGPILQKAGYHYKYETGYATKLHGLCVAWKAGRFEHVADKLVRLDDAPLGSQSGQERRTGCSRRTRNTGLLVALRFADSQDGDGPCGVIVVTHHLFWHARHIYERARQVAILLHEIELFRTEQGDGAYKDWPCFFAGDFNVQPSEATYRLMTGAKLTSEQEELIKLSSVVHSSWDEHRRKLARAATNENGQQEDDDGGDEDEDDDNGKDAAAGEEYAQPEGDEDRVLKNTRAARAEDGLLSLDELKAIYQPFADRLTSVYGAYSASVESEEGNRFGERAEESLGFSQEESEKTKQGYYEPAYTNITPLWRCTLDYIVIVPPLDRRLETPITPTHLLVTHRLEDMEPGLPRMGKEPSDHVALMAQLEF